MAFADQKMGSSRIAALGFVALLHVGVAAGLLLFRPDLVKKIIAPIQAVEIKDEAPPPEEPPPPPPKEQEIPPYVPPPEVTVASEPSPSPITVQSVAPQPQPTFTPAPPVVAAPAPAPTGPTQRATANPRVFEVSEDDYPPSSLRAEEEGVVAVTVTINPQGRVEACSVTASSNFPKLDERTCKIAQTRWRFKPALQAGTPVGDTLSKRIRWQINRK